MFNLKVASISWVITVLGLSAILIIYINTKSIHKEFEKIHNDWELYQTELSYKYRLESSIQSSMGYGGMVHNFRNYVLRKDSFYLENANTKLNQAVAFSLEYKKLDINSAETNAIENILSVLQQYRDAIIKAQNLIQSNTEITEVFHQTYVNDQPAIQGFNTLRLHRVSKKVSTHSPNKSELLSKLYSNIGYSGMIHEFKNYVLNQHEAIHKYDSNHYHEITILNAIQSDIEAALLSIDQYRKHSLNEVEINALLDIENTIKQYLRNAQQIQKLREKNLTIKEIDAEVFVNDSRAINSLALLETQINRDITLNSKHIDNTFFLVENSIQNLFWVNIFAILFIFIITFLIMNKIVIQPLTRISLSMKYLVKGELETEIYDTNLNNEIGQIAKLLKKFKHTLIALKNSESKLSETNTSLKEQLDENHKLRQKAEDQTEYAMQMADKIANANKTAEKAVEKAENERLFLSSILNAARDAIITINEKGIIETFNPGAEYIFQYRAHEVIGKNISILMPEPLRSMHDGFIRHFLEGKSTRNQILPFEQVGLRKDNSKVAVEISLNTLKTSGNVKFTGIIRDITDRKENEKEIRRLAMKDPLTGLYNRNQFEKSLTESYNFSKRLNNNFCLMMIDLDKFKPVNDSYGHHIGDILLQKVAQIFKENCRETDVVARIGGDEFAVILNVVEKPSDVSSLAERLIDNLSKTFEIENHSIQIGASIGISCFPADNDNIEILQINADKALYKAKESGRNNYQFFNEL